MNLFEIRNRLSPSNFIRKSAPVLLGASILVSSSCSNVKGFVKKSDSDASTNEAIANGDGVKHAYTAKKSDGDFVKLLEHKMSQPQIANSSTQSTAKEPSVQNLLAAGKDPFIEESSPQPEPVKQVAEAGPSRVLDLTSLSHEETIQPASPTKTDIVIAAKDSEPDTAPRPFIDTEIELTSGNSSLVKNDPVTTAIDSKLEENETTPDQGPRPFIASEQSLATSDEANSEAENASTVDAPQEKSLVESDQAQPIPDATQEIASSEVAIELDLDDEKSPSELIDQDKPVQVEQAVVEKEFSDNKSTQQVSNEVCPVPTPTPQIASSVYCPPTHPGYAQSNVYHAPEITGDEYIHDGGDSGTKVYYSEYARYGLDVEDTIAEYDDDVGVAHVKPSTRATIYAPKFAAVRTASQPFTDVRVVKLAGHQDQRKMAGIETKQVFDEKTHNDEALGIRLRSRPSGVEGAAVDTSLHQNIAAQRHVKLLNAYEEIRFFREGQLARLNVAVVGDSIAAALDWNGDLGVHISAHDFAGQEVKGRFTAQDYTAYEDRSTPGDLTIVKVVDKKVAKPGEVLTFTIRFDNKGDRPLRNIRIVDNLSPRLAYIEESVDSDLDGKLDTEDNGRGSQILNFTFDNELKGHTGGWVSFKCKVR